jgi:hypothetical protein
MAKAPLKKSAPKAKVAKAQKSVANKKKPAAKKSCACGGRCHCHEAAKASKAPKLVVKEERSVEGHKFRTLKLDGGLHETVEAEVNSKEAMKALLRGMGFSI